MAEDIDEIREQKREQLQSGGGSPGEPVHVESEAHLEDIVAENARVLIDFYADWCGPCQMLEPTMEALAAETDAVVAKVDIDTLQSLAGEYGVRGVPTVVVYADGEQVDQVVGVREKSFYERALDSGAA